MWRGFGADAEPEPAPRSYFRPRISSISGVLAMTKQRLFTSGPIKDEVHEQVAHTAAIHPVNSGQASGSGVSAALAGGSGSLGNHHHLGLTDQYMLNGGLIRCPSPARSSYGDVMSFSRSASARPSIDSQTAHAIYGDPLGIHDPSEAELGNGPDNDGRFAKRSRKILRGFFLMLVAMVCWVATIHLIRMSFHSERVLLAISPIPGGNYSMAPAQIVPQTRQRGTRQTPSVYPNPYAEVTTVASVPQTASNFGPAPSARENQIKGTTSRPQLPHLDSNMAALNRSLKHLNDYPRSKFDAPFLVTWFVTIWNIFYLPVYLFIHHLFLRDSKTPESASANASVNNSAVSNSGPFGSSTSTNKNGSMRDSNTDEASSTTSIKKVLFESAQGLMDKGFTGMQFLSRCAFFCSLCLLANYMLIFSLRILDGTVAMSIYSTSVSIIYLLSWVVLHQQFVGVRIVAIIITDTGIALLVYMDGVQHRTLATVMIAFGSAIVFSVYRVFMRRMIGYTTFAQMALFHSIVGVLILLLAWPIGLLLYVTGVEIITWSEVPYGYLAIAAFTSFLANIINSFGVICTYEAFLTLGLFFAIPISAVIDIYLNSVIFRDMKLAGVLLILVGFAVVLLPDNWNSYLTGIFRKRLANWKKREEMKKLNVRNANDNTSTGQLSRLRTSSGRVK